jgi:hypothetical protein
VTIITDGAVVVVSSVMRNLVYKCEILFLHKYRTKPVSNIARGVTNTDYRTEMFNEIRTHIIGKSISLITAQI